MSSIDQNKQLVAELFDAFRAGDTSRFDGVIAADYKQHNPQAGNGLETVKALFGQLGRSTSTSTGSSRRATSSSSTRTTSR